MHAAMQNEGAACSHGEQELTNPVPMPEVLGALGT